MQTPRSSGPKPVFTARKGGTELQNLMDVLHKGTTLVVTRIDRQRPKSRSGGQSSYCHRVHLLDPDRLPSRRGQRRSCIKVAIRPVDVATRIGREVVCVDAPQRWALELLVTMNDAGAAKSQNIGAYKVVQDRFHRTLSVARRDGRRACVDKKQPP